ncbi:MAG TPA: translocation/assembly module TamB domain-containing protein, partial [Kofleriaceae bacterium]
TGKLEVNHLVAPALRGLPIDAVLELSQPAAAELAPKLTVKAQGLGSATAEGRIAVPDRPFDPAAWQALGRGALHGATVHLADVAVDPAMLERFGVQSPLRGWIGAAIDVGEAGRTLDATIDVGALRGGPIAQPIDVHVTAGADERATTAALTVANAGRKLVELSGRLPVSLAQIADLRRAPGAIRNTPLSATAQLASVDVARLLAVFGRDEITGGRLDGSVRIAGTLGRPRVTANLVATQLAVPPGPHGTPVRTVDRLAVTGGWDGETVRLDVHGAESHGGTLDATAVVRPDALREATVTIRATKFDLVPVLAFAPGPAGGAAGQLDADLRVTGLDLRDSRIAGELHLTGGRIPTAPAIGTLRDARIDAVIADREVRFRADGKLGGGSATLDGTVALDGAVPSGGTAKIALRNVSPIGSIEPQITADITGTLSRDRSRWIADMVVDHGKVSVPKDRGEKLKPVGAPSDMRFASGPRVPGRPVARPAPANPIFVVRIYIQPTRVESEEFRGDIKGRIELRTDGEAIALLGGVEADGGDLELFGRRYAVERAAVRFDGSLDPLLDVRITHDFPEVTTVTQVHGRASKPELEMSSDPGTYSRGQLLGFLLGGEPAGEPSGSVGNQAAAAGESYVANLIGGYVKQALPVDIDVLSYQAATSTSSAAVTVGTWVTPSLFLAYRQRLESRPDENTGEGELEYWLTRRIVIEGTIGNRGYDSVDLVWRKRY